MTELAKIIEAILFVSGEPVQLGAVARALEVTELEVSAAADELASDYDYNPPGHLSQALRLPYSAIHSARLRARRSKSCCSLSKSNRFPRPRWKRWPWWPTSSQSRAWISRRCAG